jgi:hypothetical protein
MQIIRGVLGQDFRGQICLAGNRACQSGHQPDGHRQFVERFWITHRSIVVFLINWRNPGFCFSAGIFSGKSGGPFAGDRRPGEAAPGSQFDGMMGISCVDGGRVEIILSKSHENPICIHAD